MNDSADSFHLLRKFGRTTRFFLTKQRHCENQLKLSRREAGWLLAGWLLGRSTRFFSSLSKDIVKTNLNYLDGKLDGCLLDGCLEDQSGFFLTKQRHCENQLKLSRREAGWLLAGWLLGRSTTFFSSLSKDIVKTNLNYLDGKLDGCLLEGCLEDQPGFFPH